MSLKKILSRKIIVTTPDGIAHEYPLSIAEFTTSPDGELQTLRIRPYTQEEEGVLYQDTPLHLHFPTAP